MQRKKKTTSNEWKRESSFCSNQSNLFADVTKKKNEYSNSYDSNNEMSDSEDLENLPEYERELILAKRHEELVRKKQRFLLLKNVNVQNEDHHESLNNKEGNKNNKKRSSLQNVRSNNKKKTTNKTGGISKKNEQLMKKNKKRTSRLGKKGAMKKKRQLSVKKNEQKMQNKKKQLISKDKGKAKNKDKEKDKDKDKDKDKGAVKAKDKPKQKKVKDKDKDNDKDEQNKEKKIVNRKNLTGRSTVFKTTETRKTNVNITQDSKVIKDSSDHGGTDDQEEEEEEEEEEKEDEEELKEKEDMDDYSSFSPSELSDTTRRTSLKDKKKERKKNIQLKERTEKSKYPKGILEEGKKTVKNEFMNELSSTDKKKTEMRRRGETEIITKTRTATSTMEAAEVMSNKDFISLKGAQVGESKREIKKEAVDDKYILKKKKLEVLVNKIISNEHKRGGGSVNTPLSKHMHNETYDNKEGMHRREKTERAIHLYKQEKQIKLDIYKYMTYESISRFQLKRTFLLDMSEHIYFARFVIGHVVKIIDMKKLIRSVNALNTETNDMFSHSKTIHTTSDELTKMHTHDSDTTEHCVHSTEIAKREKYSKEKEVHDIDALGKKKIGFSENGNFINSINIRDASNIEDKKRLFFITNVIENENYFCTDRYTNVKFELTHFENINHLHFFDHLRDTMIKNIKVTTDISQTGSYAKYICNLNDISDDNISVDEYNYIKLYSTDVNLLKQFSIFIREKLEDLKQFHYTEKQIQDLVEMKKRKNLNELFMNNTNIESLSISRVTIQKEICSLLGEIDTLNYSKRRVKKEDVKTLENIHRQIEFLTKKIEKFRQLLEQSRRNTLATKCVETHTQDRGKDELAQRRQWKEKNEEKEKQREKELLKGKSLNVDDGKKVFQLLNRINIENRNFLKYLSKKLSSVPIQTHHNICKHFLLNVVHYDTMPPNEERTKKEKHPFEICGISISEYVTTLKEIKGYYE